jgi:hypothetical protein
MPEVPARSYRFPGGYEAAQRSHLNTTSASLRISGDVGMNAPPDSYYVIDTSQATVTTVVAGPLPAHGPADLLASLYNAEWRYCERLAEWFTVLDGRVYSAGGTVPDTGPALDREALQPRAPGDWHHHETAARAFVAANWTGEPGLPSSWTDATHGPALLSHDGHTVYFPATGSAAAPHAAAEGDWLLIDGRGNVTLQSGSAALDPTFSAMLAGVGRSLATAREILDPDPRVAGVIARLREALARTGDVNAAFKEAVAPLRRDRARPRPGQEDEP